MNSRYDIECSECGRTIGIGDDYITSELTDGKCFCSEDCMKRYIAADDKLYDKVIEEWMESNAEWYQNEADDPYDRYGVSERDFI